jgi:hypothetical protein
MRRPFSATAVLLMLVSQICSAQRLNVKIIDRRDSTTSYTYVVAGYSKAHSNTDVNCSDSGTNVNCSGSTRTTGSETPPHVVSYEVRGSTFSLLLPDGRVAVVNCESKTNQWQAMAAGAAAGSGESSDAQVKRSCRMPIVDDIQAEFKGNKAKLKWPVSIDGKKMESETYKILGVLDKP